MKSSAKVIMLVVITLISLICFFIVDTPYRDSRRLIDAIWDEDVGEVQQILEAGVDPNVLSLSKVGIVVSAFVETGPDRPLSEACLIGNLEIVELLIRYGATSEPGENGGYSPLICTLYHYEPNDMEIIKLLLENGTDTVDDDTRNLPVFWAADMLPREYDSTAPDNVNPIDYLKGNWSYYKDGYKEDYAKGITKIVDLLLEDRSLDIQTTSGKTLLMIAIENKNIYLADYLLLHGCNIHIKDNFGRTAYDYAIESECQEIIDLLMKQ